MPSPHYKGGATYNGATRDFAAPAITATKSDAARFSRLKGRIILPDLDFFWLDEDAEKVLQLWNQGKPLEEMSHVRGGKNAEYETYLLLVDLAHMGKLPERKGGLY